MKGIKFRKTLATIVAIVLVIGISAGTAILVDKKSVPAMTTIKNGLSAYELASENGYTGTMQEWLKSLQGKSAYEIAVDGGYKGTEAEWTTALTKLANSNPVGIKTASFNDNGELVLTLSDDTNINLGKAVGVDGKDGVNGINGKDGANGQDGKNGTDGKDGIGITDVDINGSGELVLSFSDKKTVNLGKVVGTSGMNGLSAYEIAVLTGKTTATSEAEWIESLKGAKGDTGAQGPKGEDGAQGPKGDKGETGVQGLKGDKGDTGATGNDGATPYIKNGNWWIGNTDTGITAQGPKGETGATGQTGAQGSKGDKGDKGDIGATGAAGVTPHIDTNGNWWIGTVDTGIRANGKSAYEVALENNPNLTYDKWIESLKGSTGANGKSAYELAIETGLISSTISVADWIESLKGADGNDGISPVVRINPTTNEWEISIDGGINFTSTNVKATGEKGADGQNGSNGEKGADGISPKIRINAETNEWEVSIDNGETYTSTGVKATGAKGDAGANGNDGSNGKDGLTPEIKDGIWWIGDKNTGISAEGKNGTNGKDAVAPQIRIDVATNMWEISTDGGNTFVTTNVKATGDKGADGQNGAKGDKGESAFEIAKRLGLTNKDNETAWIESLKGEKGATGATGPQGAIGPQGNPGTPGKDGIGIDNITLSNGVMTITLTNSEKVYKFENLKGSDGITPQLIIEDGKWKVSYNNGNTYTELGDAKGSDGITPTITDDGYWKLGDNKTSFKAVAVDGKTPYIKNGTWWIGDEDTEIAVTGQNGENGKDGKTPEIGSNNNWWIDGVDTGKKAVAQDGANGQNGADGNGVVGITVNEYNYLVIDMKYGEDIIIEKSIVGAAGKDGKDGNGIKSISLTANYELVIETDDGTTNLGPIRGPQGPQGIQGVAGANGLTPILSLDENGNLSVKYGEDGTLTPLGNIKGPKGDKGDTGSQGPKGDKGDKGDTGRGIAKTEIINGHLWVTYTDDLENPVDLGAIYETQQSDDLLYYELSDGTYGVKLNPVKVDITVVEIPSVYKGKAITQINEAAFADCATIERIIIPDSIKEIKENAFNNCNNLKTVYYFGSLEQWNEMGFANEFSNPCSNGASLYIGNDYKLLTEMTVPETISTINQYAFYGCSSLTSVILPDSVETVGDYSFSNCANLSTVQLSSVTTINTYAFSECTSLKKITIPSTVTFIGRYAFYNSALENVTFETTKGWTLSDNASFSFSYTYYSSTYPSYGTVNKTYTHNLANEASAAEALVGPVTVDYQYNRPEAGFPTTNFSGSKYFTWYKCDWCRS